MTSIEEGRNVLNMMKLLTHEILIKIFVNAILKIVLLKYLILASRLTLSDFRKFRQNIWYCVLVLVWKISGTSAKTLSKCTISSKIETLWKLCISAKFPHQEISRNFGIFAHCKSVYNFLSCQIFFEDFAHSFQISHISERFLQFASVFLLICRWTVE